MFDWKWNLSDINQDKPLKVFTIFSCGGGSSMGYKRAGFEVIGNCELDPRINKVYVKNHHPKYNFLMDAREFAGLDKYPDELMNLDILDGSPPCSTFSTSGKREKAWGVMKKFAEGQKLQRLDDLFFVYLEIVRKLRPKVSIAENVTGLVKGNAKGYVSEIIKTYRELGYEVQIFKLNGAFMNVPQKRERVFFIANRCGFPKLKLNFNYRPILFGDVRSEHGSTSGINPGTETYKLISQIQIQDHDLSDVCKRLKGKESHFSSKINHDNEVAYTLDAGSLMLRYCDKLALSKQDIINISSFPQDYDFLDQSPQFICGMSVPPNMMANIASEIYKQWFAKG